MVKLFFEEDEAAIRTRGKGRFPGLSFDLPVGQVWPNSELVDVGFSEMFQTDVEGFNPGEVRGHPAARKSRERNAHVLPSGVQCWVQHMGLVEMNGSAVSGFVLPTQNENRNGFTRALFADFELEGMLHQSGQIPGPSSHPGEVQEGGGSCSFPPDQIQPAVTSQGVQKGMVPCETTQQGLWSIEVKAPIQGVRGAGPDVQVAGLNRPLF